MSSTHGDTSTPDPVRQGIAAALGRVPSGVFILTARHGGRSAAMLVSWVQQASFEPPAVVAALAKDRPIRQVVEAGREFALSVVPQDDKALMRKYARPIPPEVDPFEGMGLVQTAGGQPALADALAYLECRLMSVCDFGGDHDLFVAAVTGGAILKPGPSFTHLRGNGFRY